MKQKFLFMLLLTAMYTNILCANKIQDGDLFFNLDESTKTAEVTYKNNSFDYSTANKGRSITTAHIPSVITYNGIDYDVTSIGDYAFYRCEDLSVITIPHSVTKIGSCAFGLCHNLTLITIPDSVTAIGEGAFRFVPNILFSGSAEGSPWGAKSINGFADSCFVYKDSTKCNLLACYAATRGHITIPNSVKIIGEKAFFSCKLITSITIPNSVITIEEDAFEYCSSLNSVMIGNSVTKIGGGAFENCNSLTTIEIPNSVTTIEEDAFRNCSSLTSVMIGSSVTSIGGQAFRGCRKLISIKVDTANSVLCDIDGVLFSKNKKILCLYPAGKTEAAYTCPSSVTKILGVAFANADSLTTVFIPKSVVSMKSFPFQTCNRLTVIEVDSLNSKYSDIDGVLFNKDYTKLIAYPNGKEDESYTIPNSVTVIESTAFNYCHKLKFLTLGSMVKMVGFNALNNKQIETITCYGSPPQVGSFNYIPRNTVIYVPEEFLTDYKKHDFWGKYDVRTIQTATE